VFRSDALSTVLLTGGSGFIGSHCIETLLGAGLEVHAVCSSREGRAADGVVWHRADLLDEADVAGLFSRVRPTHLLHLAWFATPGLFPTDAMNYRWTSASLDMLRHFVENGGSRVVTAGTSYEYDWRYGFCSEEVTPLAPDSAYGSCKKALAELTAAYAGTTGLSSAWGRVFFLYGPREYPERLVSSVIRSVLAGEPAKCSHGEQIRDYMHVQDVADAFVAILLSDATGPVNVASGVPVTLKSIVTRIGAMLGRPELIELGAIPARPNDVPLVVADVRRLVQEVCWRQRIPLDEGLDQTIAWWRDTLGAV
jgi:nucleoside-diphosphate-sugar epimerase